MKIVITGANRGIGLELTRQYLARGEEVVAGVRHPERAHALSALTGALTVLPCDVADTASVAAFAAAIPGPIDVLINNAGVSGEDEQPLDALDYADVARTLDVNAIGPLRVTAALLPHLERGAQRKIVHITSGMGSIADNRSGGAYGYRMSKAALNMACRSMAVDLAPRGLIAVVMNPGWVKTDMGGPAAPTPVEVSAAKMIAVIEDLRPSDSGTFMDYRGRERAWPW